MHIALSEDVSDETYLKLLGEALSELFQLQPELVFFQGGVDALKEDKLGRLSLSRETLKIRNTMVLEHALRGKVPIVLTMGGGYSKPLSFSVDAHADLFQQAAQLYSESVV